MKLKSNRSLGRPRAFNDKIEQNTVKSLDRALTVLTTLSKNQNKTLTDLSKELGESPSTVYRILSTMALHQIVECDDKLQTWNIGPGSFSDWSVVSATNKPSRNQPSILTKPNGRNWRDSQPRDRK